MRGGILAANTGRRIRIDAVTESKQQAQPPTQQASESLEASADRPLPPRLERLLRLLHCLQARSMFSSQELADTLNVSRRTVYRDISLLRDAGIDVDLDAVTARYSLAQDFNFRPRRLDDQDLAVLSLAVRLSLVHAVPELSAATQQALAKLVESHNPRAQLKAGRTASQWELDWAGLAPPTIDPVALRALGNAMQARRRIWVTLHGSEAEPLRQIKLSPFQIVVGAARWELVGRSCSARRILRIDLTQIQKVELTDDEFEMPARVHGHFTPVRSGPNSAAATDAHAT